MKPKEYQKTTNICSAVLSAGCSNFLNSLASACACLPVRILTQTGPHACLRGAPVCVPRTGRHKQADRFVK